MRLFTAVPLPEKVKRKISEAFLSELPKGARKVREENLHITLNFLGEKSEEEAGSIAEKIGGIGFSEFEITASGIGSFGANVLWIGLEKGEKETQELHSLVSETMEEEKENFHAHITIARNKKMGAKEFIALKEKLEKKGFSETFSAQKILLLESVPGESGPVYRVLSERTFSKRVSGS